MHPLEKLDLVELVQPVQPPDVLSVTARLPPETGRVGASQDRKLRLVEDLVAEEIGQRHLRGRDREQAVGRRLVHLALLVGKLAGGRRARRIHEDRRVHLGISGQSVLLQKETHEGAHEARRVPHVERKSRSRDLGAAREIEQALESGDLPVRDGVRRRRPRVAVCRMDDIVVRPRPFRNARVRQIRKRKHLVTEVLLRLLQPALPLLYLGGHRLHLAHLRQEFRRALRERGHFRVGRLLARAQLFDLLQLGPPGRVGDQRRAQVQLDVLLGDRRANEVGRLTDKFGIEHGGMTIA
jgi:hypothetical protein